MSRMICSVLAFASNTFTGDVGRVSAGPSVEGGVGMNAVVVVAIGREGVIELSMKPSSMFQSVSKAVEAWETSSDCVLDSPELFTSVTGDGGNACCLQWSTVSLTASASFCSGRLDSSSLSSDKLLGTREVVSERWLGDLDIRDFLDCLASAEGTGRRGFDFGTTVGTDGTYRIEVSSTSIFSSSTVSSHKIFFGRFENLVG